STKAVGAHHVCLGGSGSVDYGDRQAAKRPGDFRDLLVDALARELCEETGMVRWFPQVRKSTMLIGFFRWIDRCGLPEFVGLTRAGDIPFTARRAIDGDEVVRYEEIPVTVNRPEDFHKVFGWVKENNVRLALSSLMTLHRL